MNKLSKIFLLLFLCMPVSLSLALEPPNLYKAKQALIHYHDSGAYDKDVQLVMKKALDYLRTRTTLATSSKKKLAIILDIDETSLSNYSHLLDLGFGGSPADIEKAELEGTDTAIAPTLKLFNYAKSHHVAVFFLTGRLENERESTIHNLQQVGYNNWDGLILKPLNHHYASASIFKAEERRKLVQKGYDIILNIGDQQSDLAGKYADKTFKLPNPYYYIA